MNKRIVIAGILMVVALAVAVLLVQYLRGMTGAEDPAPPPGSTLGPAEGGALETGGALYTESSGDIRHLPARNMPDTISEYPPTGPETDNPPPSQ